jgi:DNA ligase-1
MRLFTDLYFTLDETAKASRKAEALKRYFAAAPAGDAAWALSFLVGETPGRAVKPSSLRLWACSAAGIPEWLFDECREAVGDTAETIALIVPGAGGSNSRGLRDLVEERLLPMQDAGEELCRDWVEETWREMDERQRFVWNRMISGGFRAGVSRQTVIRALGELAGLEATVIAHRLLTPWEPTADFLGRLLSPDSGDAEVSRPYPFHLACTLEGMPEALGNRQAWCAEWQWDGMRAQAVKRSGTVFLWSRGGELLNPVFPELAEAAAGLPGGTVIDGEIVPWKDGAPLPCGLLQKRIGRASPARKLREEIPAVFMAFDLVESGGRDIRQAPLRERREALEKLLANQGGASRLRLSPVLTDASWEDLTARRRHCRVMQAGGLVLKRFDSPYETGRHRGSWWKWKIEPCTIDAILLYAQPAEGEREDLVADYTFGLWRRGQLVPVARIAGGLTGEEVRRIDAFIRRNTLERFGPVRSVRPQLVFELAFEGVEPSARRKSGITLRGPRIVRWKDKPPEEADSLESLKAMLHGGKP